ncbi:hypothetical protein M9H77_20880 [Catharanthus roseus]|uniref:Uncharacterized protein n=1 Tax=Catharanthus roseus TaxID=4058 RepID=A0ACC0AKR5_CATRO|nr:hypothetical protein M9H77_20880 [Catharanthus roseus]
MEASYGTNAYWKDPKVAGHFIDFCLEAVPTGNRRNIRTMPWEDIRTRLKEEEHLDFTVQQLIHRWTNQKRRYKLWSKLVAAAGNAYDPMQNKINWSKKEWKRYSKVCLLLIIGLNLRVRIISDISSCVIFFR